MFLYKLFFRYLVVKPACVNAALVFSFLYACALCKLNGQTKLVADHIQVKKSSSMLLENKYTKKNLPKYVIFIRNCTTQKFVLRTELSKLQKSEIRPNRLL